MLYHLWSQYYKNATGTVYVVDSSAGELTMKASARLLKEMISHRDLKNVPLLILVNKQDLEWSKRVEEISNILNFKSIQNRPVHITGCCGITGEGLSDAFRWLYESIYVKFIEEASWVTKRLSPRAMRRLSSSSRNSSLLHDQYDGVSFVDDPKRSKEENVSSLSSSSLQAFT